MGGCAMAWGSIFAVIALLMIAFGWYEGSKEHS